MRFQNYQLSNSSIQLVLSQKIILSRLFTFLSSRIWTGLCYVLCKPRYDLHTRFCLSMSRHYPRGTITVHLIHPDVVDSFCLRLRSTVNSGCHDKANPHWFCNNYLFGQSFVFYLISDQSILTHLTQTKFLEHLNIFCFFSNHQFHSISNPTRIFVEPYTLHLFSVCFPFTLFCYFLVSHRMRCWFIRLVNLCFFYSIYPCLAFGRRTCFIACLLIYPLFVRPLLLITASDHVLSLELLSLLFLIYLLLPFDGIFVLFFLPFFWALQHADLGTLQVHKFSFFTHIFSTPGFFF